MTRTTQSASASSAPTKRFEIFGKPATATTVTRCQVFAFEAYAAPQLQAPAKHTQIKDLIGKWERDSRKRAALEEGRRWVADTFHGEDGDTVRTLRLRKGWSQTRLAEALGTSQSHVARIERGTENVAIETCRKLCMALDIDMNTLNLALARQETIAQAKRE